MCLFEMLAYRADFQLELGTVGAVVWTEYLCTLKSLRGSLTPNVMVFRR